MRLVVRELVKLIQAGDQPFVFPKACRAFLEYRQQFVQAGT